MSLVVTQEGARLFNEYALQILSPTYFVAHLFSSPYNPSHVDTYPNFHAIEPAFANGYNPIPLNPTYGNWSLTNIAAGDQAVFPAISWTFLAAITIYGYFLTDYSNSISLWAESFGAPYTYGAGGGVFQLMPQFSLTSQP